MDNITNEQKLKLIVDYLTSRIEVVSGRFLSLDRNTFIENRLFNSGALYELRDAIDFVEFILKD